MRYPEAILVAVLCHLLFAPSDSSFAPSDLLFKVAPWGNHLWRCARERYVLTLNAVFAFVFSPSPLKLTNCNKQWLNSVLVPSMLKFWVLALNYKCPNHCVFCCVYGFICDFLKFPSVKSSKIFTAHRTQQDTNFKHEKSRVCSSSGSFLWAMKIWVEYWLWESRATMDSSLHLSSPDLCTLPIDLAASILDLAPFTCRLLPLKVPSIKIFSKSFFLVFLPIWNILCLWKPSNL